MADLQIGSVIGVNANAGVNINGGDDDGAGFTDADMATVDAMRTRLAAIDATAYSAANLNTMTLNDMVYALRVHDNLAGVN